MVEVKGTPFQTDMVRQHEAAILYVNYAHKMFYLPPLV